MSYDENKQREDRILKLQQKIKDLEKKLEEAKAGGGGGAPQGIAGRMRRMSATVFGGGGGGGGGSGGGGGNSTPAPVDHAALAAQATAMMGLDDRLNSDATLSNDASPTPSRKGRTRKSSISMMVGAVFGGASASPGSPPPANTPTKQAQV